jgi:hypothetical protein
MPHKQPAAPAAEHRPDPVCRAHVRPSGWSAKVGTPDGHIGPTEKPHSARPLGRVEWSWSPMHSRLDAYYLSLDRSRTRWLLWLRPFDDNWGRWERASVVAHSPRARLAGEVAGKLLLMDYWASMAAQGTGRFHRINEQGLFDAAQLRELAGVAWR